MWWNRKTKEQKEQELQAELAELEIKYAEEINSYCKIKDYIFILKGFEIQNGEVRVVFKDATLPEGFDYSLSLNSFWLKYASVQFKVARVNFIIFKHDLEKLGLKLEKI